MKSTQNKHRIFFLFAMITIFFTSQGCLNMKIQRAQKLQVLKAIRNGEQVQQTAPTDQMGQMDYQQTQSAPVQQQAPCVKKVATIPMAVLNPERIPNHSYTRNGPTYTCINSPEGFPDLDEGNAYAKTKHWIITMVRVTKVGIDPTTHALVAMEYDYSQTYSVAVPVDLYKSLHVPGAVYYVNDAGRPIAAEGSDLKKIKDMFTKKTYNFVNDEGLNTASYYLSRY